MALLDIARDDDRHTSARLTAAPVIGLGTVRPDGRPHNVRNVRASPAVCVAAKFREKFHVQRVTAWTPAAAGIAYRVVP